MASTTASPPFGASAARAESLPTRGGRRQRRLAPAPTICDSAHALRRNTHASAPRRLAVAGSCSYTYGLGVPISPSVGATGIRTLLPPANALADLSQVSSSSSDDDDHPNMRVEAIKLSAGTLYVGMEDDLTAELPGNGGLRVRSYETPEDAIKEAEALASAMTKKHRMYNTGFAGAKLVFDADIPVGKINKEELMMEVSKALASYRGTVYTGCDINTTDADMLYLDKMSPFVLAAIGAAVDANLATADGTFAAVVRTAEELGLPKNFKVLVQGCGKVGTRLATDLVDFGAEVFVSDVVPGATNIAGTTDVSDVKDFASLDIDIFSPCAIAGIVTDDVATRIKAKAIVGAANIPFANEEAREIAASRGIIFIPEYITSAGAIIVDSLELCFKEFADMRPSVAYKFVHDQVYSKAGEYINQLKTLQGSSSASWDDATLEVTEPLTSRAVGNKLQPWLEKNTTNVDVAVVGGGMAGTSAAYNLSIKAPQATGVVLESGSEVAHKGGSSYGDTRMFRQMYSDKYFSDLQTQSLQEWRELEEACGSQLLSDNGLLFYGEPDTGETVEGSIPGCAEVMRERGLPHTEYTTAEDMEKAFDGMDAVDNYIGLFEETAGSVNSSLACQEMMRMAERGGNWACHTDTRAIDIWQEKDGLYNILTKSGQIFRAKRVVLAAGPWTNNVLSSLGYEIDAEVWKIHWGYYKTKEGAKAPQWFHFGKEDGLYYGFPGSAGAGKAKVGVDFAPECDRMDSMDEFDYTPSAQVSGMIDEFVKEQWGGVYDGRLEMLTSPYTMTKDSMFVLDTLPAHPGISIFSAGNGRAFKFAPTLGSALASLVLGEKPSFDIAPMKIDRPELLRKQPEETFPSAELVWHPEPAAEMSAGGAPVMAIAVEEANETDEKDSFGRAHVPYGEVGAAFYSKLTLGCFDVVMKSRDMIEDSIRSFALPSDSASMVRLADFGSADGGPMMPMVQIAKEALPEGCQLEVVFEDQPNNDFKSLFYLAEGIEKIPVGNSKPLADIPGVFYTACGRSFFDQCLPSNSVDICTSYTAMHWLSKLPCSISDGVHHTVSKDDKALTAFASQAAKDWKSILEYRSAELKQGGQVVIACFGVDSNGHCLGWSGENDAGEAKMYAEMTRHWSAMRDEGVITDTEFDDASFPNYYRTEDELKAPFEDPSLGLKLKAIEWRYSKCPFGRTQGTPAEVIGTMRTWSNSTYVSALSDSRSEKEKAEIVDQFYNRYEMAIAAEPERHHMDYVHAYIQAEKM